MSNEFVEFMQTEFEMNMVGDLTFFLELQIKQMNDGIFISQIKYTNNATPIKFPVLMSPV
jgi:hypothetical protein